MFPGMTTSFPNFLTPNLWPGESRPLNVLPAAFFVAHLRASTNVDSAQTAILRAQPLAIAKAMGTDGNENGVAAMSAKGRKHPKRSESR